MLLSLGLVSAACSGHGGARGNVQLTIRITDLPAGTGGSVLVTGPDAYRARLTRTTTLRVAAGRYRVAASGVRAGADTFYPQDLMMRVMAPGSLLIDYAEQVPPTTKVLDGAHLGLAPGTTADGGVLAFEPGSAGAAVHAGDVIVIGQGRQTPRGLVRRVVSVSERAGEVLVRIAPGGLRDAIPRGSLRVRLPVDPTASLGLGGGACGSGSKFTGSASASVSGWVDFDIAWGFATPNFIKLVGGVNETADASLSVADQGYCKVAKDSEALTLPSFPLPLGPFELTVTPKFVAHGEARGTFTVGPGYGFHESGWAKAGFTWGTPDGSNQDLHPIYGAGASYTATPPTEAAEENLWAGAGPQVDFDIEGFNGGPFVNFLGGMTVDNKQQTDGSYHYSVSGDTKLNVGIRADWGPLQFSVSQPFTLTSRTLFQGDYGTPTAPSGALPGKIVFSCGQWDSSICVMNPDGSNVSTVKLCGNPEKEAGCGHPALSPDGTRLAYEGPEGTLAITSLDGKKDYSPPDQHPGFGSSPTWSPRGDRLAFTSCGSAGCSINTVDADGTGLRSVLQNPQLDPQGALAWSPDGNDLAFATRPSGTPIPAGNIDVVSTDAGATRAPHSLVTHVLDGATALSWAPGHTLLFTNGHEPGIWEADTSGWPASAGPFDNQPVASLSCGTCADHSPSWAPDGVRFCFVRDGRVATATLDQGVKATLGPRPVSYAQWDGTAS